MKYPIVILLFISVLIIQKVYTQTPEIEQLLKKAENAGGKEKINALADLCKNFSPIDPHKGIQYGEQALRLADSLKIQSSESRIYNSIGVNYWALSDFKTARSYYNKALKNAVIFKDSLQIGIFYNRMGLIYESLGDFDSCLIVFNKELTINKRLKNDERTGNSLENIGTIHLNRGEFKSAITYFLEAKTIYEKSNNKQKLPYVYMKLGSIYSETKDYSIAEKWFQKGIEQSLAINDLQKAGIGLNAIGVIRKHQGMYNEALAKFNEALEMIKTLNNKNITMAIYDNIGLVYALQKKFEQALKYHKKALELAIQLNMPLAIARCEVNMGESYNGLKNYLNARMYFEKALPAFKTSNARSNLITTYKVLINVNDSLKDFAQSVKYYQLYQQVKDSLSKTELNTTLDSLKVKFNTEEIDHENTLLTQKTEIQNKTITLQRTIMISSLIFLILLISLAIVIVRSRQKIKKANDLLAIKNLDLSAKAEALRMINDKLLELSKFKDSMNSFLVHDLKNPLNAIINLDSGEFTEQQVQGIRQSGKKMLDIVMNMLDISKYEDNKMNLSYENISISYIVNKAFNHVEYLAEQKSINLKTNYQPDFFVKADPEIIERVFINLFTNAIKYSPAGDIIKVSAEFAGPLFLKVIVKDNGDGIEAEFLPVIFDKFTKASVKQKGLIRSTGIGLAFCKLAVESHGGEIGVDSVAGQGASFWFTLPLADSQQDVKINPAVSGESSYKFTKLQLSAEEINLLIPHCDLLKKLSIYQISDVKDVINGIDIQESANITVWKSLLLQALSDCNELTYNELINLDSDDKL